MKRDSLVTRVVLLAVFVALGAVAVAGAFAYPLVRAAAESEAVARLAALSDVTASAIERRGARNTPAPLPRRLAASLEDAEITGYLVFDPEPRPDGISADVVRDVLVGLAVSSQTRIDGVDYLVEGRPLADGSALLLLQPKSVAGGAAQVVLLRLALALAVGLLIAAVIGALAARRLIRPLQDARNAAARMATGERDVAVEPSGPSEIADISVALNRLSAALATSEQRQREFLLSVSHELRTPLTAVRGYGEALGEGLVDGEEVPRTGAIIVGEARRLERLVNDLLDLARLGAVDFVFTPVPVDLVEIAREAGTVWADRCGREGVHFAIDVPNTAVDVDTDPVRVRQIIDNLMENALRVAPPDSIISIAVGSSVHSAQLQVSDAGPGLSLDDRSVAFEPGALYERYRGLRPVGTGLGLALVGRLARGLGGSADVSAAPTGGAMFTITLPKGRAG